MNILKMVDDKANSQQQQQQQEEEDVKISSDKYSLDICDRRISQDFVDGGMITKMTHFNPKTLFGERYKIVKPKHTEQEVNGVIFEPHSDLWYSSMKIYPRGRLMIFNMKTFEAKTGLDEFPRYGTDKDAERLTMVFSKLGFIVERFDDLSKRELLKVMSEASQENYNNAGSFFCALLTHGQDKILYAKDDFIEIRKLTKMFRGSNLAGKPKVFLIQACQGSNFMESNDLDAVDGKSTKKDLSLPVESDFLYAYSTAAGFYSWRNSQNGSWFIQTLCDIFEKEAKNTDIVRMLTKVNRIISSRKSQTNDTETNNKRQIASTVSQLRKELYLFPPVSK